MTVFPEASVFVPFALAVLVLAITPGPDMTLFVGRALAEGRAAGLAAMFGAMTGILVHSAMVALGLSALIVASPEAFMLLKVAGAGYLVWLAIQALRGGSAFRPDTRSRPARPLFSHWATGLGINLLNPKIILFFMTFLPQFVSARDSDAPEKLFVLGLLFIPLSLPVTVPMVLAADGFSRLLRRRPMVMRAIDYLFAGVFAAFALRILLTDAR